MIKIWADRLLAFVRTGVGQQWARVPPCRVAEVKAELAARVKAREARVAAGETTEGANEATAAEYQTITGETYTEV